MTITFKKNLPRESDQTSTTEANESESVLSNSRKRALRRMRMDAAKQGMIIPYEPRSQPRVVDPDAPKVTNTAKRMARKRRKYAAQLAELGLTVEEGGPTYLKTKKRKKNSPAVGLGTDASTVIDQNNIAENPATDQPEKSSVGTVKKKRKQLKKAKKVKKNSSAADNASLLEEEEISTKAEKKKKKKSKKSKDVEENTQAADNPLEENFGDVSPLKEEIKVKVENESADEEMAPNEAALTEDTPIQEEIKVEMPAIAKKQRFILFLGNLSYDATEPEIRAHFSKVGKIVSVRISKHVDKAMEGKNKGCAHLEVADEDTYLKALSMHRSMMKGRRINVEYSSAQTKDMRLTQKVANRSMKAAMANDDILDLANPCESKTKKKQKKRRTVNHQQKPVKTNQVWV